MRSTLIHICDEEGVDKEDVDEEEVDAEEVEEEEEKEEYIEENVDEEEEESVDAFRLSSACSVWSATRTHGLLYDVLVVFACLIDCLFVCSASMRRKNETLLYYR